MRFKIILLAIFFLLFHSFGISQKYNNKQIDSLKTETLNCDSVGIVALEELILYYQNINDPENQRFYIDLGIKCHASRKDKYKLIDAYWKLIIFHSIYSELDSSLDVSNKVLDIISDDSSMKAKRAKVGIWASLGSDYYIKKDDVQTAYRYFNKSIDLALKNNFYDLYLSGIGNLSSYYLYDEEFDKTHRLIEDALLKIPDHTLDENEQLFSSTNKKALEYYKNEALYFKAKATLYSSSQDSLSKMNAYKHVLIYKKGYINQPVYHLEVLELIINTMVKYLPLDTLLNYGETGLKIDKDYDIKSHNLYRFHAKNLIRAGRYREAENLLVEALKLAKMENDWYYELADTYNSLVEVNMNLRDFPRAQENFEMYKIYNDSTNIRKNRNAVETVETKFQLNQKIAENLRISQESKNLSERLKLLSIVGLLLLALFGLGLVFYTKQRKNAHNLSNLNKTKDKIFAILGHDLKGPSQAFNNLTKNLGYLIKQNDIQSLMKMAPHYEESGERLAKTINNVLNWALTENESFLNNPEKVNVFPVIRQSLEELEWELQNKNLTVELEIDPESEIFFDRNALKIINRNLIHNAIKFSPENSTIMIRFNNNHCLEYIDKGTGINQNVVNKVMLETPVESTSGTHNEIGVGIGLVTCLKLVKLNNSSLNFLQNSPSGTIVRLITGRSA